MKSCKPFFGLKTLIVGDVNSGKTAYTRLLLLECRGKGSILVLDMAPETYKGVGGKMAVPNDPHIHYVTTLIRPPRLMGKDEKEARDIAVGNAERIERDLFSKAESIATDALIINDVSLYLQMGSLKRLRQILEKFPTVIMNGYVGVSFPKGPLTEREQKNMNRLMKICHQVIEAEGWSDQQQTKRKKP